MKVNQPLTLVFRQAKARVEGGLQSIGAFRPQGERGNIKISLGRGLTATPPTRIEPLTWRTIRFRYQASQSAVRRDSASRIVIIRIAH